MDSRVDITLCEDEHSSGTRPNCIVDLNGIHASTGKAVITTIARSTAENTPTQANTPIAQSFAQAPAFPLSVISSTQNQTAAVPAASESPLWSHPLYQFPSGATYNHVQGPETATGSCALHCSTTLGSAVDNRNPFGANGSWHNYGTHQTVCTTIPVWSRSMPCAAARAQQQPNFYNYFPDVSSSIGNIANATQPWNVATHTVNSGCYCCSSATRFNGATMTMPSPIAAPVAQASRFSSNFHNHLRCAPHAAISIPQVHSVAADITLSSSQIASRQVIAKDLPYFSGRPEESPLFITNYLQSTERCGFTDQENLLRLQKCLKGPALEAVRGQLMLPNTVSCAIDTLKMLFGRADVIHQSMQRKLRQEPAIKSDKLETLIHLALSVQNYYATLEALGLVDYLNDPVLLADLVAKLPSDLKLDWGRHQMSLVRLDVDALNKWLFALATCASQVTSIGASSAISSSETRNGSKQAKQRILIHDVVEKKQISTQQQVSCSMCHQGHRLSDCNEFCALNKQARWKFVREKGLCIRCFRKHLVRTCNSRKQCGVDGCRMSHHSLLHTPTGGTTLKSEPIDVPSKQQGNSYSASSSEHDRVVSFHANTQRKTMFRYIPVKLYGGSTSIETYALIDEGSACTLVERSIADELGLEGPFEELCLRWTGDITQSEANSKVVNMNISSCESNAQRFSLRNVRTVSSLDLPLQSLGVSILKERDRLRPLPIQAYNHAQERILIGLDNAKIGMPLESREAEDDDLIAVRCRIGWSVYGKNGISNSTPQSVLHVCPCSTGERMDDMLKAYFAIDSIGVCKSSSLESTENERAQKIMDESSKYLPVEQRWETELLWRYDAVDLPDSLPMAKRRLQCLETKMKRDPDLKQYLVQTIRSYEEKGYVRKLGKDEITSGGKSWYIPIFTVTNSNKNKRRLVWDAAAKVNNISLNTYLMKGPDLLASLLGVLIRFRERPVAICGDIREMFHQVLISKKDQAAQKFLWRDGDSSRQPDVFVMQVMTFDKHPEAVDAIITNTYVDDWLQSVETEDEMIQLARIVRRIHGKGGFEMRNWSSNSRRVLAALTGTTTQLDKRIEEFGAAHEKVLGLWWQLDTDQLTFFAKFDNKVFDERTFPTKRQILRVVMTIFDPLGFLGFFVIHAKIILQNIWRSGVDWDEPVRDKEREDWWIWIRRLPKISMIRLPRCYPLVSSCDYVELHTFVDASIDAYAAVSFLRAVKNEDVRCTIVASKTRVAPIKPVSIPRLELMAAVLGLRLARHIEAEMSIRIKRRYFWPDSRNVCWITSDARKFHQFVALRIGEILEDSDVKEWRWVPSTYNVADEGTKWSKNSQFDSESRWFCGPEFLLLSEDEWPKTELRNNDNFKPEEIYHVDVRPTTVSSLAVISPDPNRFSKWERLCSTQRYVLRFLHLVVKQETLSEKTKFLLESQGIVGAESVIIRCCQEQVFSDELSCLQSGSGGVSHNSPIFKCSPYIDECGLLRVRGRVDAIQGVAVNTKRPIILPRRHQVTFMIINFYHRKFHHHHNEIVVNEVRQRFYISGLRSLVKSVVRSCQLCRNRRARPAAPSMGNLPPERLGVLTLPFTYTGVDFFGPMDVVIGRRRVKHWGVLFTCLTTGAVHIEISSSLSTDSFLLVLKQFISRRGVPKRIWSDNGTNFRDASRILAEEIEKVSSSQLEEKYPGIEWLFIPPASPHMGGSWERMIRSVKSILMDILQETGLREEVLRATLADIENILNSRPLTYVPLDSPESEALTPHQFLIGSSNGIRERGSEDSSGATLRRNFDVSNQLANQFWMRWVRQYLPCLTRRTKWFQPPPDPIALHDVVIVVDENSKRNTWKKGIVVDLQYAKNGEARSAVVKVANGLVTRPIVKLAKLDIKG